ncbi:PrsW family intramembrane metalloprotease [Lacisediminihabitans profunda]|uniref:PrsW family intramembrane metalloprotease n=1 Tax=Lacisediminihabitans profunda TaxID=2594790 RepID=A0A5C8UTE2_9MICO|nr:PrsW family glutamic-type intramembrane protease [Lacisediminihabitans profunda]TXN31874.1 PrsW family intramembrane metalloprotease [Lacisediminihabitans profunda]
MNEHLRTEIPVAIGDRAVSSPQSTAALHTHEAEAKQHPHHHHGWWWKTLLAGLALWVVTIVVTVVTQNTNLVPTLILLGSFLVPFAVVLFVIERVTGSISSLQLILAFFFGGILGVLGASLLEADLTANWWSYALVGLIEEAVKGILLVIIGWRVVPKTASQGALLGATIGAGFAAFESAGYAFNAAITNQGIDIISLVQTEVIRAILAPVDHVLWTALLGAVLFGSARVRSRYRWSWWIPAALLTAALLHSLWDASGMLATYAALLLTGQGNTVVSSPYQMSAVLSSISALSTTLYVVALTVSSTLGVLALWLTLRHFRRTQSIIESETLMVPRPLPEIR